MNLANLVNKFPADPSRNNNVIITSKWRRNVILTS